MNAAGGSRLRLIPRIPGIALFRASLAVLISVP